MKCRKKRSSSEVHLPITSTGQNPKEQFYFFFFSVSVCAITASGVPGGTFVSMNRFSALCG
jgi:hypothetical protein